MTPYSDPFWPFQPVQILWQSYCPTFMRVSTVDRWPCTLLEEQPLAAPNYGPNDFVITKSAMREIELTVGIQPAESGGILVANGNGVICEFIYDSGAKTNRVAYTPCIGGLAGVISGLKKYRNRSLCGVVHSHPEGYTILSEADVDMANRFFGINPTLLKLFLPIVQTEPDTGTFNMFAYVFHRPAAGGYAMPEHSEIKEIEDGI